MSSALLHVVAIGALAIVSAGHIDMQTIRFASAKPSAITLVLTQAELKSEQITKEVRVEVQPSEAIINDKRFAPSPTSYDLPDAEELETPSLTTRTRSVRTRVDSPIDTITDGTIEFPRHISQPQLSGQVPSTPAVETTLPEFGNNRPPHYPRAAIAQGWEGTVLLRVHLSSDGTVADVQVIESSGHTVLDGSAVAAVKRWTASPATRGGRPVETTIRLPVKFRLPKR
ncbi:MAG: energy transducer TonB [Planctomycetales bacterium]|nr:energy transducer TonB [Planctomycetales bacterium]